MEQNNVFIDVGKIIYRERTETRDFPLLLFRVNICRSRKKSSNRGRNLRFVIFPLSKEEERENGSWTFLSKIARRIFRNESVREISPRKHDRKLETAN